MWRNHLDNADNFQQIILPIISNRYIHIPLLFNFLNNEEKLSSHRIGTGNVFRVDIAVEKTTPKIRVERQPRNFLIQNKRIIGHKVLLAYPDFNALFEYIYWCIQITDWCSHIPKRSNLLLSIHEIWTDPNKTIPQLRNNSPP